MANQFKQDLVAEFTDKIKGKSLIFVDYKGITVEDLTEVRTKLREYGSTVRVIKNSLLKRVLEANEIKLEDDFFQGMLAITILGDDVFSPSGKVLFDAEKGEKLKIQGGYYEGNSVDTDFVKKLATIPTKETLYSMLVGSLQGPIADLVYTLQGIADKKGADDAPKE